MAELWDIYDINKNKTGRFAERGIYKFKKGEYHIVSVALIMNSKNEILITRRAETKKSEPLKWELTGGSIKAGETSLQGILREIKEEIGLIFTEKDAIFLKEIRKDKIPPDFKDIWLFKKDVKLEDIKFTDGEVIDAKWATIEQFLQIKESKQAVSTIDLGRDEYEMALKKWYISIRKINLFRILEIDYAKLTFGERCSIMNVYKAFLFINSYIQSSVIASVNKECNTKKQ